MCHKKIAILSKGMNEFIRMVLDKGYYFLDVVGVYHFWQKKGKLMEHIIIGFDSNGKMSYKKTLKQIRKIHLSKQISSHLFEDNS